MKWQPTPVLLPGKSHGRTEEPGRLQSVGSQRVRHNWVTSLSLFPESLQGLPLPSRLFSSIHLPSLFFFSSSLEPGSSWSYSLFNWCYKQRKRERTGELEMDLCQLGSFPSHVTWKREDKELKTSRQQMLRDRVHSPNVLLCNSMPRSPPNSPQTLVCFPNSLNR